MRYFYFLLTIISSAYVSGQRIQDFNIYDSGNGAVVVKFTLSPGPACSGYDVMHSTDSLVYTSIYPFDGICGNTGAPEVQSWTHTNPKLNQTNFYKIQLKSPYETSEVRRLYVSEPGRSRMIASPNPVFLNTDMLNLKLFNAGNTRFIGFLYNRFGTALEELDITTRADVATINVSSLTDGLYVIWLTEGSNVYACKIIVKR